MYKSLKNPEDYEVTDVLKEGYELHSVTTEICQDGSIYTNLIYHFIKYVEERPSLDFNVYSDDNPFKPRFESKGDQYS